MYGDTWKHASPTTRDRMRKWVQYYGEQKVFPAHVVAQIRDAIEPDGAQKASNRADPRQKKPVVPRTAVLAHAPASLDTSLRPVPMPHHHQQGGMITGPPACFPTMIQAAPPLGTSFAGVKLQVCKEGGAKSYFSSMNGMLRIPQRLHLPPFATQNSRLGVHLHLSSNALGACPESCSSLHLHMVFATTHPCGTPLNSLPLRVLHIASCCMCTTPRGVMVGRPVAWHSLCESVLITRQCEATVCVRVCVL
jgi:hypothetical protein